MFDIIIILIQKPTLITLNQFIIKVNGQWEKAENLPTNYGGYSLFNKVRVNITDYDGDEPYEQIKIHKKMYPYNSKGRFSNPTTSTK